VDDPALNATIVDGASFDRPYRPQIISPVESATGVPIVTRIKATEYQHPYSVPIGGSRWQVALDEGFTQLVVDTTERTAASAITLITDPNSGTPWLAPDTEYYARVRYLDLRERESKWSEVVEFTTASALDADVILQPDIISPVNNGWMSEKKLIVLLSQPESIGVAVPDSMDLQVSLTPSFEPGDIVKEYTDYASPTLLLDDSVDFSTAPSPVYMRARQKDSIRSLESPFSSIPTVWLQRAFRDLIIGRETIVTGNGNISRWIDKTGAYVNVASGYWNDHPIWGGMIPLSYTTPSNATHTAMRLPSYYVFAESESDGLPMGMRRHRYWVSPTPFDDREGYLHPGFALSPAGITMSTHSPNADITLLKMSCNM
jgi:hypothetical protein